MIVVDHYKQESGLEGFVAIILLMMPHNFTPTDTQNFKFNLQKILQSD